MAKLILSMDGLVLKEIPLNKDRLSIGRKPHNNYEYGTIFQAVNAFVTVDLSAFYADVSKDRLYTFHANSAERRSAQSALYLMADGLGRLLAPILSFTADELWRYLPARHLDSVHMALFPELGELESMVDTDLLQRWQHLATLRERVLADIEPLRKDKQIGSSRSARSSRATPLNCRCCSSCRKWCCVRRQPTPPRTRRPARPSPSSAPAV